MATKENIVTSLSKDSKKWLDEAVAESEKNEDTLFIESCNIGFDLALTNGLGIPVGSSVLFYADPGCGKTTLLGDVSRRVIKKAKDEDKPFKVLYLATENSKELLKALGLDEYMSSGDFLYVQKELCWRQVETFYEAVLQGYGKYKDVKLIIIDSVNNVLSDANLTKSVADGDFGTKAKERGSFYGKFLGRCAEKGVTSFFIAQVRQDQSAGMYGDPKKAAASWADLHNVEMIVKCSKKSDATETAKIEVNTAFGKIQDQPKWIMKLHSSATNCKNRFFRGFPAEVLVVKGKGVDNTYAARKLLEANGYIKKAGGWFTFCKELQESLNFPSNNLRANDCNKYVRDNMGALIEMLKEAGQYKIEVSEETIEEDTDVENNTSESEE